MPVINCTWCDKQHYKRPNRIEINNGLSFCSKECYFKYRVTLRPERNQVCHNCKKSFIVNPAYIKRRPLQKVWFCSKDCFVKYAQRNRGKVLVNGSFPYYRTSSDKRRYHRKLMEDYLGRKLSRNEVVHHVNGNKKDNRIENLIIMDNKEHLNMHRLEMLEKRKQSI